MIQHGIRGTMRFRALAIALVSLGLSACGGSKSSSDPIAGAAVPGDDPPVVVTASYGDAFRLLRQASFGPDQTSLQRAQALGISGWIDDQISMRSAYSSESDEMLSHLELLQAMATSLEPTLEWFRHSPAGEPYFFGDVSCFTDIYQNSVWFANALDSQDQLRQRVAYALSQIMVVAHVEFPLERRVEALAHYYDILARHAFGNFRDLIGEVSRSPAMGIFLPHQGNRKGNPSRNTLPDENFARELMQLFTIGLYELNLDGSGKTDEQGNLRPSYEQGDIEELARVMTSSTISKRSECLALTFPPALLLGATLISRWIFCFSTAMLPPFISRQPPYAVAMGSDTDKYLSGLYPFSDQNIGIHGMMPELTQLMADKYAAVVANVGSLVEPVNKENFREKACRPFCLPTIIRRRQWERGGRITSRPWVGPVALRICGKRTQNQALIRARRWV